MKPADGVNKLCSTLPWLLLVALVFFATHLDIPPLGIVYDEKRILQILWLILLLLFTIASFRIPEATWSLITDLGRSSRYLLVLLLFFAALSVLNAHSITHAAQEFFLFFSLSLGILILAATARHSNRPIYLFIIGIVFFNLYYTSALTGGLAASLIRHIPVQWPYPVFGFTNIRFLNQFMVPGFPLVVGLPLLLKDKVRPSFLKLYYLFLPLWGFYLFYTGSRGAPAALILSAFLLVLLYRQHAFAYLRLLAFSLLGGYLLFWLMTHLPGLMTNLVGHQPDVSQRLLNNPGLDEQRLKLIGIAWQEFLDHPLLGIGPMHFPYLQHMIQGHPHNSIMQLLSEWGLINLLLVLALVINGLIRWFRFSIHSLGNVRLVADHSLMILLSAAFMSGALYSLVSGVIVMPLGQLMMVAITAMMISLYMRHHVTTTENDTALSGRLVVKVLCALALIGLVYFTLPDLSARAAGQVFFLELSPINIGPRFWHFGAIPQP